MKQGKKFDFLLRAQGNLRSYGVQIADNELRIVCNSENKETVLAKAKFIPELEKEYLLTATAKGSMLQVALGDTMLSVEDRAYENGMIGMQTDESSVVLLQHILIGNK